MVKKTLSTYKRCMFAGLGAAAMMFSVASQAVFIIDDFNVSSASIVRDNEPSNGPVTGGSSEAGSTVMNLLGGGGVWNRTLTANLSSGDELITEVCDQCQAAHVNSSGGNSVGIGMITYSGGVADLSAYPSLSFDWGADLANASVNIIFSDGTSTETVASWSNLAGTGGSAPGDLVQQAAMPITVSGALDLTAITEIRFQVLGVPNMDSIIDNVSAVPIPAAVYFFGSGLLALIGISRRRSATV